MVKKTNRPIESENRLKETKMRKDKEATIEAITRFQREFIVKFKRFPTYKQISEGTGLAIGTIKKRAKEVDFHKVAETHASRLGLYMLIQSLYTNATKGNIKALDRYIQYVFGIMPAQELNFKGGLSISSGLEEKVSELFEKYGEEKIDEIFKFLKD